jgi:hypothetical protein
MFQIKDRYYKVEYEGLHMLCLACGTFGHYKEGCVAKTNNNAWNGEKTSETNRGVGQGQDVPVQEGPWQVVQKNKRPRKKAEGGKVDGTGANGGQSLTGSRFAILQHESSRLEEKDYNDRTIVTTSNPRVAQPHAAQHVARSEVTPRMISKSGDNRVNNVGIKIPFESTNGAPSGACVPTREAIKRNFNREEKTNDCQMKEVVSHIMSSSKGDAPAGDSSKTIEVINSESSLGHPMRGPKHNNRPPDIITGSLTSSPVLQLVDVDSERGHNLEGVSRATRDNTMEIVEETPISKQGEASGVDMTID